MSIALTSIGVMTYYTVGEKTKVPVDNEFIQIPEVREIPDMSPDPNTIDVTSLEDTEYTRYAPALRDLGGVLPYTTNLTQEILDEWNGRAFVKTSDTTVDNSKTYYTRVGNDYTAVENPDDDDISSYYEYQSPEDDEKSIMYKYNHLQDNQTLWITHVHPKLNQATYMPFDPVSIMQPAMSVNSNVDNSLKVVPTGAPVWNRKPTKFKTYEEYLKESI